MDKDPFSSSIETGGGAGAVAEPTQEIETQAPTSRAPSDVTASAEASFVDKLAAALTAPLDAFLQALPGKAGRELASLASGEARLEDTRDEDELPVLQGLAFDVIDDFVARDATAIVSAIAARVTARALGKKGADPSAVQRRFLLDAWLDAAQALVSARGGEALLRLPSTAERLSRRSLDERESVDDVIAAIRRIASRIASETRANGFAPSQRRRGSPFHCATAEPASTKVI